MPNDLTQLAKPIVIEIDRGPWYLSQQKFPGKLFKER